MMKFVQWFDSHENTVRNMGKTVHAKYIWICKELVAIPWVASEPYNEDNRFKSWLGFAFCTITDSAISYQFQ